MRFLKKMIGKRDPVEELRRLHAAGDWAGVLAVGRNVALDELEETTRAAAAQWLSEAGDSLARLNLDEGNYAWQANNLLKASEHYQLALDQARDPALRLQVEAKLASLQDAPTTGTDKAEIDDSSACHSGCGPSCGPTAGQGEHDQTQLDSESRLELLLVGYPPELASRYAASGPAFRRAWLAVQDGEDDLALDFFAQVPEAERDALYRAELGALQLRRDQPDAAIDLLQQALRDDPDHFLAYDSLVIALTSTGRIEQLLSVLKQSIAEDRFVGYSWARLAELHAQRQETELALAAGLKALDQGLQDANIIGLCAQLLERLERFDEAEALYRRLKAGGCGGGVHPLLAEFWLRRRINLDQALESFKGALRQEQNNPRWSLRIAQVYQGKGWRKQANQQFEALMARSDLPEALRKELLETVQQRGDS
jgi:tetratricopeptide (TPR) repeat protein